MGNPLRPRYKGAHKVPNELENFSIQLERELLSVGWDNEMLRRWKKNRDMGKVPNKL